jgi:hypothetical protein
MIDPTPKLLRAVANDWTRAWWTTRIRLRRRTERSEQAAEMFRKLNLGNQRSVGSGDRGVWLIPSVQHCAANSGI